MRGVVVYGEFEWDPKKAESNAAKHGVTFEEAATAFEDHHAELFEDDATPSRFLLVGRSHLARILVVVHAER